MSTINFEIIKNIEIQRKKSDETFERKSDETLTSESGDYFVSRISAFSRPKPLFPFKEVNVHKESTLQARSSKLIRQSINFQERFSFLNKKEAKSKKPEIKICPLTPNGTWAHIPSDWLPMMTAVIDIIREAIEKDDVELLKQLQESQKELYSQIVGSLPSFGCQTSERKDCNEAEGYMNYMRTYVDSAESFFQDNAGDGTLAQDRDKKFGQLFLPISSGHEQYFEISEGTPFQDLLDFMMSLPTVTRKSWMSLTTDSPMHEDHISNKDNKSSRESISIRDLIDSQNVKIKEEDFHGLLTSNLEYQHCDHDIQQPDELEFNIKYTSEIMDETTKEGTLEPDIKGLSKAEVDTQNDKIISSPRLGESVKETSIIFKNRNIKGTTIQNKNVKRHDITYITGKYSMEDDKAENFEYTKKEIRKKDSSNEYKNAERHVKSNIKGRYSKKDDKTENFEYTKKEIRKKDSSNEYKNAERQVNANIKGRYSKKDDKPESFEYTKKGIRKKDSSIEYKNAEGHVNANITGRYSKKDERVEEFQAKQNLSGLETSKSVKGRRKLNIESLSKTFNDSVRPRTLADLMAGDEDKEFFIKGNKFYEDIIARNEMFIHKLIRDSQMRQKIFQSVMLRSDLGARRVRGLRLGLRYNGLNMGRYRPFQSRLREKIVCKLDQDGLEDFVPVFGCNRGQTKKISKFRNWDHVRPRLWNVYKEMRYRLMQYKKLKCVHGIEEGSNMDEGYRDRKAQHSHLYYPKIKHREDPAYQSGH